MTLAVVATIALASWSTGSLRQFNLSRAYPLCVRVAVGVVNPKKSELKSPAALHRRIGPGLASRRVISATASEGKESRGRRDCKSSPGLAWCVVRGGRCISFLYG